MEQPCSPNKLPPALVTRSSPERAASVMYITSASRGPGHSCSSQCANAGLDFVGTAAAVSICCRGHRPSAPSRPSAAHSVTLAQWVSTTCGSVILAVYD
jgi:hypothetical protein